MTNYNPQIHNRRSLRLQGYDYSKEGLYYITICCQDRVCLFGEIINGEMYLNDIGEIANKCWLEIPDHFPNVVLHEYIVMPNHIHGIIELTNSAAGVENFQPLPPQRNEFQKMIPRSIGSIVKGFKIGVTKWVRNEKPEKFPKDRKVWQRNYYERIVRNSRSYLNISRYIVNNPSKWEEDKFHLK